MSPRLLDLFCGAGGAAMGYHRAGFEVVGVDIAAQPHYPFEFHQADALTFPLDGFDAIHASPPCQAYSSATKAWGRTADHPDLYSATRERLLAQGAPWVIENVIGAPCHHGVVLCGSMFGLGVQRHRSFESSELMLLDRSCRHSGRSLTVTGHSPYWWDQGRRTQAASEDIAAAMGIDWMNRREIVQAIPPAFTTWIGTQLLAALRQAA
jgi:DNA (cytosine-5)-methyltransferase 1